MTIETLHDSGKNGREFAFALPLKWPDDKHDRAVYEQSLVEYVSAVHPLLAALSDEDRGDLLSTLSSFALDLRKLWSPETIPPSISAFLALFE